MNKILVSLLNGTFHNEPWEGTWKGLTANRSVCTIIKFKHFMNYSIIAASQHYTLLCPRRSNFNYIWESAEWSDITVAISGNKDYRCFKPMNHSPLFSVTSLSTYFNTPDNKKLKSNSTDILVSGTGMIIISSYPFCEYDGHCWLGVGQERQDHMFYIKFIQLYVPHSNFFWPQRNDCCLIRNNNVLLVIHIPSTEAGEAYY
jgi:hypothetical protein